MNRIVTIVSLIVIIPLIIYFWPASLGGDAIVMMVQGKSMLPTILPGSLVISKQAPEYHIGDIVAYEQKEGSLSKVIVHRIIDVTDRGFIIKGDNNPSKDVGYPTEDVILGKVMFSTPYVGDIIGMFKNPIVLIIAAIGLFGVQTAQKRRKERKEKLRCIRLGIPYIPAKLQKTPKKVKKPDYSMFFAAIFFNILTFLLIQISIENNIRPVGDLLTGFLYRGIVASLASTLILAFYFGMIFGLYFLAKSYEKKSYKTHSIPPLTMQSSQRLILRKNSNLMLSVANIGWILFVMMSLFQLIELATNLAPIIN